MHTYTDTESIHGLGYIHAHIHKSTKPNQSKQKWGSNSEVLIRLSNSSVSARKFERDFVEEESCGKCIIVWCTQI